MALKCARLLSGVRPSASADAIQPSRARAVRGPYARCYKTLRSVLLSAGLVTGLTAAWWSTTR